MEAIERKEQIEQLCAQLMEFSDSVQILSSWTTETGDTEFFSWGSGNWFARKGMADSFIQQDRAHDNALEISKAICMEVEEDD